MKQRRIIAVFLILALLLGMMPSAVAATGRCERLGHDWSSWKTTKSPTCTQGGSEERTCSRCGKKETKSISAKGHSFKYLRTEQEATCTEDGIALYTCPQCSAKENRTIKAAGHEWDQGVMTKEPGYLNPGEMTYTCVRCGETRIEEIPVKQMPISLFNGDLDKDGPGPGEFAETFDPLRIVTQPTGGFVTGSSFSSVPMSVEAEGGEKPYTYQWYKVYVGDDEVLQILDGPDAKLTDHSISGATEATYEARSANFAYYCKVTDNNLAEETSDQAVVRRTLEIVKQPENTADCEMDPVILSCEAKGGVPYSEETDYPYVYQWFDSEDNYVGYGPNFTAEKMGEYYCLVTDYAMNTIESRRAVAYEADPFECKTDAPVVELQDGQEYELRAEAYGGIEPYTGVWMRDGEEISTQPKENGEFSASITGDGIEEVEYTFVATDAMDDDCSLTVHVRKYHEPLTIISESFDQEVTNQKKARLKVEIKEGTDPYTYTLLNDGVEQEKKETHGTNAVFEVEEPGWYAIRIEDQEGRLATSKYHEVGDARLRIVEQPKNTAIEYDPSSFPSITLSCKAVAHPDHPLTYEWQAKTSTSWMKFKPSPKNTITLTEAISKDGLTYYQLSRSYRCIVRDTVTGEEVISDEAAIHIPMTVFAYKDGSKQLKVDVTGGFMPYTIECVRSRMKYSYSTHTMNGIFDPHGTYDIFEPYEEPYYFPGGLLELPYSHKVFFTIKGLKKGDRYVKEHGWKNYWTYNFTVTDSHGQKIQVSVNMEEDETRANTINPADALFNDD